MRDATLYVELENGLHFNFNPRIPCGMRLTSEAEMLKQEEFQSTHPMRDATGQVVDVFTVFSHFNPRIPCGMRRT